MMKREGNVIACVWDFDKTLIPGCMQVALFRDYGIDEETFWGTVDAFPKQFRERGLRLSETLSYLNFILALAKRGRLPGLTKEKLMHYGENLTFFPGVPEIFSLLRSDIEGNELYRTSGITLEHYVISSGHGEIIRGSKVAAFMEDIFASEFLGRELEFEAEQFCQGLEKNRERAHDNINQSRPPEIEATVSLGKNIAPSGEIEQIACVVDHTQKTRYLFEINKGCNKNAAIGINSKVDEPTRRVPFSHMIYIADGLSDIPAFSVVRNYGGKAFAVHNPDSEKELAQNDGLLAEGRIDAYGPADYRLESSTTQWLRLHIQKIAQKIVEERAF
jgi:hypothetical protein